MDKTQQAIEDVARAISGIINDALGDQSGTFQFALIVYKKDASTANSAFISNGDPNVLPTVLKAAANLIEQKSTQKKTKSPD